MKYLSYIWFLVFFLIMGCDDNPVVNCAEATAEIVTNEWPGQLEEFNTAIGELDESYTLPDDNPINRPPLFLIRQIPRLRYKGYCCKYSLS